MAAAPAAIDDDTLSFSLPSGDFERFTLHKERDVYTEKFPLNLVSLTWNVSGRLPPSNLGALFDRTQPSPDVVIVALQQVPTPTSVIAGSIDLALKAANLNGLPAPSISSPSVPSAAEIERQRAEAADPDAAWTRALLTALGESEYMECVTVAADEASRAAAAAEETDDETLVEAAETSVSSTAFCTLLTRVFVHLRHAGHVRRVRSCALRCGLTATAMGLSLGGSLASHDEDDGLEVEHRALTASASSNTRASFSGSSNSVTPDNFGALAVRFQLYQSTVCALNCHLAASPIDVQLRNSDYAFVVRNMFFDTREPAEVAAAVNLQRRQQRLAATFWEPRSPANKSDFELMDSDELDHGELDSIVDQANQSKGGNTPVAAERPQGIECEQAPDPVREIDGGAPQMNRLMKGVFDHDHVIFLGGMNYRLDLTLAQIVPLLQRQNWQSLLAADDLSEQRVAGTAFSEFCEAPLSCMPTHPMDLSVASAPHLTAAQAAAASSTSYQRSESKPIQDRLSAAAVASPAVPKPSPMSGSTLALPTDHEYDIRRGASSIAPAYPDRVLFTPHPALIPRSYVPAPALPLPPSFSTSTPLLQSFDPVYEKASAVANDPNWQSSALSIVRLSSHKPMRCTFSFDARFVLDDAYEARKLAVRARYARWRTALQQKLQVADLGNLMPCRERFSWRPPTAAAALAEKAQAAARLANRLAAELMAMVGETGDAARRVISARKRAQLGYTGASEAVLQRHAESTPIEVEDDEADANEGLDRFGDSLKEGIVGVVALPVRQARKSGTKGFFKGLGKGLMGLFAKPVAGVLDLSASALRSTSGDSVTADALCLSLDAFIHVTAEKYIREHPLLAPVHHSTLGGPVHATRGHKAAATGAATVFYTLDGSRTTPGSNSGSNNALAAAAAAGTDVGGLLGGEDFGKAMAAVAVASQARAQPLDEKAIHDAELELAAERAAVREPVMLCLKLCDNSFVVCVTPYRMLVFTLPDAYHAHPDDPIELARIAAAQAKEEALHHLVDGKDISDTASTMSMSEHHAPPLGKHGRATATTSTEEVDTLSAVSLKALPPADRQAVAVANLRKMVRDKQKVETAEARARAALERRAADAATAAKAAAERARGVAELKFEALLHVPAGYSAPSATVAAVTTQTNTLRPRLLSTSASGDTLVLECVALDAERIAFERRTVEFEAAVARRRAWERAREDEAAVLAAKQESQKSGFFKSLFGGGSAKKEPHGPPIPKAPDRPPVESRVTHRISCWHADEATRAAKLLAAVQGAMQTLWSDSKAASTDATRFAKLATASQ